MDNHPAQPAGTPVEEGRRRLTEARYGLVVGLNTTQNRGELWMRGLEPTRFIPYVDTKAEFFSTEVLERALAVPPEKK